MCEMMSARDNRVSGDSGDSRTGAVSLLSRLSSSPPAQMPTQLPNEMLELIVEHMALNPREECIGDLLSCSLASSAFISTCQKHIFHTVKIWIHAPLQDRHPSSETLEYHQRALQFIQIVIRNPSLGLYVQHLSHYVTSTLCDDYDGLHDILRAFDAMPNIITLELGHRSASPLWGSGRGMGLGFGPGLRGAAPGSSWIRWREGVSGIVARPQLGTLRLRSIENFPIDALSTGIRELDLVRSWFDFRDKDWKYAPPRFL
jgi:hypothetical protein